jgi:hypothetical protein
MNEEYTQNTQIRAPRIDEGSSSMRPKHCRPTSLSFVLISLLFTWANSVYVYSQLPQFLTFTSSTPQVRLKANLGQFNSTQQFTLWGWYRFNGDVASVSNILTLRNLREIPEGSKVEQYPNTHFPACPYSLDEISKNPELLVKFEVLENPNCSPELMPVPEKSKPHSRKQNDLLYINFDLKVSSPKNPKYSVFFVNQVGNSTHESKDNMRIEAFEDMNLVQKSWSFFAVSCDYINGEISIFLQSFDGASKGSIKTFVINFPEFSLSQNSELIIASVENSHYFQSTSGFIGDIGMIEIGNFYTIRLDLLWMGYLPQNSYLNKGVELEFLFDDFTDDSLMTSGSNHDKYKVDGRRTNIQLNDPTRIGWTFYPDSKVDLKGFSLRIEEFIRTMAFYLQFDFSENVADEFYILRKGTLGMPGYFGVSLAKKDASTRIIRIHLRNTKGEQIWNSTTTYQPSIQYKVIVGISSSPANQIRAVFWDSRGQTDFSEISPNFTFDFRTDTSNKMISLFGNSESGSDSGNGQFTFYRFIILNSASPVLLNYLTKESLISSLKDSVPKTCKLRTSFYAQNFGCLLCDGLIANLNRTCSSICPVGYRNGLTDICIACQNGKCLDNGSGFWTITKIANDHYQLRPSRPLLNNSTDLSKLVSLTFPGGNSTDFNYTLSSNIEGQYVDIYLNFYKNIVNQTLLVDISTGPFSQLLDANRNRISSSQSSIVVERFCFLEPEVKRSMDSLAITALVIFLVSLLVLLIFTIIFYEKILDLASLWKFLLHNWIRFQLVGSLYLLGIYMPCCAKAFLNVIYDLSIGWNQALSDPISNFNKDSVIFRDGLDQTKPPSQFLEQGVLAFILHNMCIALIVHGVILLTYVIIKIWDWFKTSRAKFMYLFFLFMEFSVLIAGYGIFHLQAFIFSGLNFRLAIFTNSYFIVCFVIAICYVTVFAAFWLYAAFRLIGPSLYFANPINNARFYYFFAGYRDSKWAKTYDLWYYLGFSVIGLMIGIVWQNAIAQLAVILAVLVTLFVLSVILRPWNYLFQLILELTCQLIMIAVVIILLIIAVYDSSGCFDCGNREGGLCLLIVALLFIYLMLLSIGLIMQTLFLTFCQGKSFFWGKKAASGLGFVEVQHQFVNDQAGKIITFGKNEVHESNIRYSTLNNNTQHLNHSNVKFHYHQDPILEASDLHYETGESQRENDMNYNEINDQEYGYNYYDHTTSNFKPNQENTSTMLEFMNDVRRNRENEEVETYNENRRKSEINYISAFKGSKVNHSEFHRPGQKASSLIDDKADEESMQERVVSTLAESRMVNLHESQARLSQNVKGFKRQKDNFYESALKTDQNSADVYRKSRIGMSPNKEIDSQLYNQNFQYIRDVNEDAQYRTEDDRENAVDEVRKSTAYSNQKYTSQYFEDPNANFMRK